MPLTKRQFEIGITAQGEEWMRRIYEFLSGDRKHAYSRAELYEKFVEDMGMDPNQFPSALDALEKVGGVEAGEVRGTMYYTYRLDMDTVNWIPYWPPKDAE